MTYAVDSTHERAINQLRLNMDASPIYGGVIMHMGELKGARTGGRFRVYTIGLYMPGQGSVNNRRTARAERHPDVPCVEEKCHLCRLILECFSTKRGNHVIDQI